MIIEYGPRQSGRSIKMLQRIVQHIMMKEKPCNIIICCHDNHCALEKKQQFKELIENYVNITYETKNRIQYRTSWSSLLS